jgi:hypothetical protein
LGVEKIKTISDAYMAAAGLPEVRLDHAEVIGELALGMIETIEHLNQGSKIRFRRGSVCTQVQSLPV